MRRVQEFESVSAVEGTWAVSQSQGEEPILWCVLLGLFFEPSGVSESARHDCPVALV